MCGHSEKFEAIYLQLCVDMLWVTFAAAKLLN
jgi:hypothetical protein